MKRKEKEEVVEVVPVAAVVVDKVEERNQKLVIKAKAGDKAALARLCEHNYKHILTVMMVRTRGKRELSEDLTQDVIVKIMANLGSYENTGFKFRSWLSRIIKSVHIDHVRREKVRVEHYATSVDFTESGSEEENRNSEFEYNVLSHGSVEQDYIKAEMNERMKAIIMEGIESLGNVSQKRAIVLQLFEDMKYEDISERLGVNLNDTKSLIYRAKQGILKNIVKNNYHMAGGILNQLIVQENILTGLNAKKISKSHNMTEGEVKEILESSLGKIYKHKFYGAAV